MKKEKSLTGLIGFNRLHIRCIIGVYPEERTVAQDLFVSFKARIDFFPCSQKDDVNQTVCYDKIAQLCSQLAIEGKYSLLETYAVQVLTRVLEDYPVSWAWIKIEKPGAIRGAESAMVELEMEK